MDVYKAEHQSVAQETSLLLASGQRDLQRAQGLPEPRLQNEDEAVRGPGRMAVEGLGVCR